MNESLESTQQQNQERNPSQNVEVLLDDRLMEQPTIPIEEILANVDMGFLDEDFNEGMILTLQGFQ